MRYEVGQHVQISPPGEPLQSGIITRAAVAPTPEMSDGSPFFKVDVDGVETLVLVDEIKAVIPDLTSADAVEEWLDA